MSGIGAMMKQAVGKGSAEALVEEQKQESHLDSFGGEPIGVTRAVPLQQAVGFELAKIVAQGAQPVLGLGEAKGGEQGREDLLGRPAADLIAAVQQHLQQADDTRVMDLDAGMADCTDGDGQGDPLEQREVDVNVEPLGLKGSEAVGNGQERLAHRRQVIQPLLESEVGEVVGADLVAQEGGELLVLLDEGVFPVGAEDMMAVLDLLQGGVQLAAELFGQPHAKDLADLVGGQAPQADLAATRRSCGWGSGA